MTFTKYHTSNSWDFGFGICFPCKGEAIDGLLTVRPWMVAVMFGPWTWELEADGRTDVIYEDQRS